MILMQKKIFLSEQQKRWQNHGMSQASYEVKTFNKSLGSDASSAGVLIQPIRTGYYYAGYASFSYPRFISTRSYSSNSLEYVREKLFTNSAAPVKEKAQNQNLIWLLKTNGKYDHYCSLDQASRQVMDDAVQLQSYVNNRLLYGLALVEEEQLLNGDGTGIIWRD